MAKSLELKIGSNQFGLLLPDEADILKDMCYDFADINGLPVSGFESPLSGAGG